MDRNSKLSAFNGFLFPTKTALVRYSTLFCTGDACRSKANKYVNADLDSNDHVPHAILALFYKNNI